MPRSRRKFDIDEFVRECLQAWEADGAAAVKDVLDRTLGRGCAPVRECFGDPREAHLQVLYPGPELVIENMVWAPGMSYPAHNHNTPVMTGVYAGLEVNDFYHPSPRVGGRLQRTETVDIGEGDAVLMGYDAIHRIANPNRRSFTGAFHIYMGDYLHSSRSIWYPDEASETTASFALTKDIFAAANRDLAAARLEDDLDQPRRAKRKGMAELTGATVAAGTSGSGGPSTTGAARASAANAGARRSSKARAASGTLARTHLHPPGDQG
jgi:predicted metal-dependent enzyme (double-stranded beta helix superfamily)